MRWSDDLIANPLLLTTTGTALAVPLHSLRLKLPTTCWPQRLKPLPFTAAVSARLKPCSSRNRHVPITKPKVPRLRRSFTL